MRSSWQQFGYAGLIAVGFGWLALLTPLSQASGVQPGAIGLSQAIEDSKRRPGSETLFDGKELKVELLNTGPKQSRDQACLIGPKDTDRFISVKSGSLTLLWGPPNRVTYTPGSFVFIPKRFEGVLNCAANSRFVIVHAKDRPRAFGLNTENIYPVRINLDLVAGMGLDAVAWDDPTRTARWTFMARGSALSASVFESTPASNTGPQESAAHVSNYPYDQVVWVMAGSSTLTPDVGDPSTFKAGDVFVVPKGFTGVWAESGTYRELIIIDEEAVRTRPLEIAPVE